MPITRQNYGEVVLCDFCNADGFEQDEKGGSVNMGGGLIGSNAVCQKCFDEAVAEAKRDYPEELSLYHQWDKSKSFGENCIGYRNEVYGSGDCVIEIYTWDGEEEE